MIKFKNFWAFKSSCPEVNLLSIIPWSMKGELLNRIGVQVVTYEIVEKIDERIRRQVSLAIDQSCSKPPLLDPLLESSFRRSVVL